MNNMTQGTPWKVIIRFMIPVLMGNLLQLTYSIADTRIVGTFLGDSALAGVGSTTVLHSLYIGFFMGIANGFAIMISYMFGAGKPDKVKTTFATALLLGGMMSVIFILTTLAFLDPVLHFLNVPSALFSTAKGYIRIILAGMIITMFYDIFLASARAIGDSVTPLLILILSVGLNIVGDIILLGIIHTGVKGAAAATVLAQFLALFVCAIYLLKKYSFFRITFSDFRKMDRHMSGEMIATGLSMGLMSSLINIGSLILQTAINQLGSSYIVAQTAARKITEALMSVFVAMGQTLATYCGQNYGAGDYRRIKKGMHLGYILTCSWCIAVFGIVYLFSPSMIRMITGSSDIVMIQAATKYLRIDCILYVLVAVIFVQRNSLQGIGDRITPLISSGIEMAGKIFLTYTLVPLLGYLGVILVEPIVWIIMIIPLIIKMRRILGRKEWQN